MEKHNFQRLTMVLLILVLVGASLPLPAAAQSPATAQTIANVNLRGGPDESQPVLTVIPRGTTLLLEGRDDNGNWVLVSTADGATRGWMVSRYLVWPDDVDLGMIPVVEAGAAGAGADPGVIAPAAAVEQPNAWPVSELNLRRGPDTVYESLGLLPAGTGLVVEARTADGVWALVHTADGQTRGWVAAGFLSLREDVSLDALPVADGPVDAPAANPAPAAAPAAADPVTVPAFDVWDHGTVMAVLNELPVIPAISDRMREVYAAGQAMGNNPRAFAKIGDSNTERLQFMGIFSYGMYNLGEYGYLQETIDYFRVSLGEGMGDSFTRAGLAARAGLTAWMASDTRWALPECPNLTQAACEYRQIRPSVALIFFGPAGIRFMTHQDFAQSMRRLIDISLAEGVIPVLFTFPMRENTRPGEWEESLRYNGELVLLAQEYGVPLVNLWRAAYPLPDHGMDADQIHLSMGPETLNLAGDQNQYGYAIWNLTALQTLDAIRQAVMQ